METLFNQITDLNNEITEAESIITNTKKSSYYKVFHREAEQGRDLREAYRSLRELYRKKYNLLNTLQLEVNKQLGIASMQEYELKRETLKTA